jgi:hypothetical protein
MLKCGLLETMEAFDIMNGNAVAIRPEIIEMAREVHVTIRTPQ